MMGNRWIYKEQPLPEAIQSLSKAINVNPFLSTVLLQRGISNFEQAQYFFRPQLAHLYDPFLLKDMDRAVARMKKAIDQQEKILVYGDYDVDGTTSVAMVFSYLHSFYPHCDFYIPDRHAEGYGVSEAGIRYAVDNNIKLIIALDLGVKALEAVHQASVQGIDFIICDHHLPGASIPQAVAVLDPKRDDCAYPFKELSGCGLGFKLLQAFAKTHRQEQEVFAYLDLVAVSIASDIVPINDENRVLAYYGIQQLNQNPRPGLKALKEIAAVRSDMDISSVVFTLGPRINAAGRVAHARAAVELLLAKTDEEANELAEKVNLKNDTRREFDLSITEEAIAMIEGSEVHKNANATVLFKETWHKGVIGIVASRCIEKYYRPTIILTESNDKITGSARSIRDFDLYEAISACSDLLDKFGGHKYAAGLTLDKKNLDAFRVRFEEVVGQRLTDEMRIPVVEIDTVLPLEAITPKFNQVLKQMAPFGPENQKPIFEARNVYVRNALSSFKDRHIRFLAGQENTDAAMTVVGFDMAGWYDRLATGDSFRMAFTVEENNYNGMTSIQLRLKDLKFD
jgi:single-stranded-DNA-specific exonuclease